MAIKIHPEVGDVLLCDFSGFQAPEMTKRRPVINLTPRRRIGKICLVVPLSTTAPDPEQMWHKRVHVELPHPFNKTPEAWAKCDMLYAVSFDRLFLFRNGKTDGKRNYLYPIISAAEMKTVWEGVFYGLGRSDVIKALDLYRSGTLVDECVGDVVTNSQSTDDLF